MNYWLMKSEPNCYSIDDLKRDKTTHWDGVRNYQARNMMRDDMKKGDLIFFYHSNAKPTGIVGVATVCKTGYPDHTAFDPNSDHPDLSSDPENPRWFMVDIRFKKKLSEIITLDVLKKNPALDGMQLVKRGNRLSVMPVSEEHWDAVLAME